MNFVSIEGRVLSAALRLHCAIIEKRNSYPILANVRMVVDGASLTVTGTDLDIEATTTLDVINSAGAWQTTVPAHLLGDIARVAGSTEMRIEEMVEGDTDLARLRIIVGDAEYQVATLSPDSFPEMPGTRGGPIETFTNGRLAAMLDKVSWCISTEEIRYYLNGVCWQIGGLGRRMMATDGHRLAICRYDADAATTKTDRIIPRKTVALLRKFAAGADVTVHSVVKPNEAGELVESQGQIEFAIGATTIRSKLIEGTFPDVDRVIPKPEAQQYKFGLNRDAMLGAIGQAMTIASKRGGKALAFREDDGVLTVRASNPDTGSAKVTLPGSAWPDGAPEFGLNGRYFRETLQNCEGDVTLHQIDAGAPFTVTDEDGTMTRVIMPMRV